MYSDEHRKLLKQSRETGKDADAIDVGACHRFPPLLHDMTDRDFPTGFCFPSVSGHDWCGEYRTWS
jgi:hypothetical protein